MHATDNQTTPHVLTHQDGVTVQFINVPPPQNGDVPPPVVTSCPALNQAVPTVTTTASQTSAIVTQPLPWHQAYHAGGGGPS